MNKKILIGAIVLVIIVLFLLGIFVFKNYFQKQNITQNPINTQNTEQPSVNNDIPSIQIETQGGTINTQGASGQGGLIVCMDKCGDGICQKTDPNCKDGSACICPETNNDCPKDCK